MAERQSNLTTVLRGLREVARVTFTQKPVETNFHPQKPSNEKRADEAPADDKIPLRKFGEQNELILAPEYLRDMKEFFANHAILDTYTAPCYFNNDTCDMTLCVFPRIMRPLYEQPFVKDIISITIRYDNTVVAMAEYNTADEKAVERFENDIAALTPEYYRNNTAEQQHSLRDALLAKFPGLVIPEEPVFLEPDEPLGKEQPHAI